jgi:hypothetical protein
MRVDSARERMRATKAARRSRIGIGDDWLSVVGELTREVHRATAMTEARAGIGRAVVQGVRIICLHVEMRQSVRFGAHC